MGQPKQLLPLGGEPLLRHTIRTALASQLAEVIVVLGHRAGEIASQVGELGQKTVINTAFAQGQSTSLRAGLDAVDSDSDAALFLLGDQPEVPVEVINQIMAAHARESAAIVAPTYGETTGHPVLFSRELFDELRDVSGDVGAREVIARHRDVRLLVPVAGDAPPGDADTPAEYSDLVTRWSNPSAQR